MKQITDEASAALARYEIEQALIGGAPDAAWELRANDKLTATFKHEQFEFGVEWGKLIFAWWDGERAENWRVTDYEVNAAEVRFRALRGLGREVVSFTLRDAVRFTESAAAEDLSRNERRLRYVNLLAQIISGHCNAVRFERLSTRAARAASAVSRYARIVLKHGTESTLAIGVNTGEEQTDVDDVLASALVWLAHVNRDLTTTGRPRARKLWLCTPRDKWRTLAERLTFINTGHLGADIELYEVDEAARTMNFVRPFTQAELLSAHPREVRWPRPAPVSVWRERIVSLAPDVIEVREDLHGDAEGYAIHGLEFARSRGPSREQAVFGVVHQHERARPSPRKRRPDDSRRKLTEANFDALGRLVQEIIKYRSPQTPDTRHAFYCLRAEAWLESLLRQDIHQLDPALNSRHVYAQVPAWRGDERSVIDLLTLNRDGRLVVVEIKAAEDAQLPLQGLDYWVRVEQARRRGDFARCGLFAGLRVADVPPLLYLVAPQLRFHRTFATVARCLAPEVGAFRVGLNSDWRAGVRVRAMARVNA